MSAMLDSFGFIDNIRVMAICVLCEVPITDTDRSRRTPEGHAHLECPDAHQCDGCAEWCLEPSGGADHKVCCVCLQRSYDRNAPKGWKAEMCAKCEERR